MRLPNSSARSSIPEELIAAAYDGLIENFRSIYPISKEIEDQLRQNSVIVHYKPREVILNYGEVCNYCLICVNGIVKSTFILDGLEKIVWFMSPGDIVVAVHSWYDQKPSEEKLTALKDTICIAVSWQEVRRLLADYGMQSVILALTEKYYSHAIQRTKWQQYSTDGKIENLEQLYPVLMQEVPSVDLANFLGVSRETFIRKRPRKGKN